MYLHVNKTSLCSLGPAVAVPAHRFMLHSITTLNNDVIGKKWQRQLTWLSFTAYCEHILRLLTAAPLALPLTLYLSLLNPLFDFQASLYIQCLSLYTQSIPNSWSWQKLGWMFNFFTHLLLLISLQTCMIYNQRGKKAFILITKPGVWIC